MINKIKNNEILSQFISETCCENEICVTIDEGITKEDYVIIKVDQYYNSLNISNRPASVDCLIIRKCQNSGFGLTLVELKNIDSSKRFDLSNLLAKFDTTLNDFISNKFESHLNYDYNDVKLFFVSNKELYKRDLGLKMEILINAKFKFGAKTLMITPKMPTPSIKKCYG